MDHLAKKHLQEEFDATLEERDQMITVLQTQVCSHGPAVRSVDDDGDDDDGWTCCVPG